MRIIGGRWRSRKLVFPRGARTRPVPDRVREAVFGMLGAYYGCPGGLPSMSVADLFAGSGSMGLEALSRGAGRCCFFERDRAALRALRENIRSLEAAAMTEIVDRDAWRHGLPGAGGTGYALMVLDPPYADSDDASCDGLVRRFLRGLGASAAAGTIVVLHHRATVDYAGSSDEPWVVLDSRRFGTNQVTMFRR